ncbi:MULTISPECIES: DUF4291 domain-containing protein [Streptomyces]|uniref:DUF4291 domain-containing protein n=1 Tax=Streptomyces TaxID=1883 RepID=UPI001368E8EA|nr:MULTISPECIES: DUF4291 domain-containing protein [Streptomyces]MYV77402.1 DUF4291 family protein [Streptomyces sp. SID1046]WSC78308.1 DUF4291 domain-containing protein [Streptomyces virginiae]
MSHEVPTRAVRAAHTDTTITVYQAYSPALGLPAARDGRFPPAWKRERMTWIKPSFLWMMYRCGWGTKDGQETVLAVEITREGFDRALREACLSHYVPDVHADRAAWQEALRSAPTRVQWDPERDLRLNPLPYRSLQLGLSGPASRAYADEWTVAIRDVTGTAREIRRLLGAGDEAGARALLPTETPYPTGPLPHLGA